MPYATFLVIHLEVGQSTKSLAYQRKFWPALCDLIKLADQYDAKLTLQFNPQWAEYILADRNRLNILKKWQQGGHEVALHHHGYDHENWDGFTNRPGKSDDGNYLGNIEEMMKIVRQLAEPYALLTGTVSDEDFDYPSGIKYDTEGITIEHARSKLKKVVLGKEEVIQAGMAFLPFDGEIERYKMKYMETANDEIYGLVTHEYDFAKNPEIYEEWFRFTAASNCRIGTVSGIVQDYSKTHKIHLSAQPLTFLRDVTRSRS